jgi:hypothetical protein
MGITSTTAFTFRLIANGQQLDLFQDEDIQLSNNVTGLFDIGLQPADFTRQITIPGSKVNNAFFEHYYDISIDSPFLFSTSTKVNAYFEFDSLYLSNGYIQLNKVNLLQNKFIESYEITMYGTISSFGRDINKYFLTDLSNLSVYNHTSSYDNIEASWSGSLFGGDIVYPLADYGTGLEFTPGNVYTGMDSFGGALPVQDFKPAIRAKVVWDAIFDFAGYTYSSSFWNEPWLDDVYLICNNSLRYPEYADVDLETLGLAKIAPISASGQTNINITQNTITNLPWYNILSDPSDIIGNNASYTITLDHSSSLSGILNLDIQLSGSLGAPVVELIVRDTGSLSTKSLTTLPEISNYFENRTYSDFAQGNIGQNVSTEVQAAFYTGLLAPGTYYFALQWRDQFSSPYNNFTFKLDAGGEAKSYIEITKVKQAADGRVLDIPLNMPFGTTGIKLVDFITGIQRKFNLVMYPDTTSPNRFIVETFNNWYNKGEIRDFNQYINLNSPISVTPANNLAVNNLNFGDTLDTDFVSQQFFKGANREYGTQYYIDTQNFFSQGNLDVKTTFASSPLIRIQGTGLSGSVGGINPPITKYSVGTFTFTNLNNAQAACSSVVNIEIFTTDGHQTSGQIAYYDQYGITPVTGYYYFSNSLQIYPINVTTGLIGITAALCRR